jgi:hypothetical protein
MLRPRFQPALIVCMAMILAVTAPAAGQKVFTVAGGAIQDGSKATNAALAFPEFVAADAGGNLYISDSYNNRIRKVDVTGVISTIAGTGIAGYSGDGGQAKNARINTPEGIVVNTVGNVIFADSQNNAIRMISVNGSITTIAGNGTSGYGGDGGPAKNAILAGPNALILDKGNDLYFSDRFNQVVRKIDAQGIIHLFAGTPGVVGFAGDGGPATSALLNLPDNIGEDAHSNIFIADSYNSRVRKVDGSGKITTVAGNGTASCSGDGGPATSAGVPYPQGLLISGNNLLVTDNCATIRSVNLQTDIITTYAGVSGGGFDGGNHTPAKSEFRNIGNLSLNQSGAVLVVDSGNNRVRQIGKIVQTITGGYIGDGHLGTQAALNFQAGIAFDATGNLFIADGSNSRVRKVTPAGMITTFAGNGITGSSGDGGPATSAELLYPQSVAPDLAGNVYIGDELEVRKVDSSGTISKLADGFIFVTSVATDVQGNVYVDDVGECVVWKIDGTGAKSIFAGLPFVCGYNGDGIPATQAELYPYGIAADGSGNLYIADSFNSRVRRVDSSGTISTVVGTGIWGFSGDGGRATAAQVTAPYGVAVNNQGTLAIADTFNYRVRTVSAAGIIKTSAGTGFFGYNGNGLPATSTNLSYPIGVAISPAGVVYVSDAQQYLVRKIQ